MFDFIPMADITPIACSLNSELSTFLIVDRHNSDSIESARTNKTLDSSSAKNVTRVPDDVVEKPLQFLRKLFLEELGNDRGLGHKLIIIAVHAVLLESGFVGFDPNENRIIDGFHFSKTWPSLCKMSLFYTRPEIVAHGNTIESIVLKFQSSGKFINVYGSLDDGGSGMVHLIRLNEDQLVPPLNVVWANYGANEDTSAGKEVLKFWRDVKDNLALPLWIGIYEKVGFDSPPCFMKLPSDLKLKILEKLQGDDVAKIICTCSELNLLAQSDDLWKLKFDYEFHYFCTDEMQGSWKNNFATAWKKRNEIRKLPIAADITNAFLEDALRLAQIFKEEMVRKHRLR